MTDTLQKAIEACVTSQAMIDINAMHLDGLRTQCELGAELTQTEIRNLETKLIKLFSSQLVAKRKYSDRNDILELQPYPQLKQWLKVVGLCDKLIDYLSQTFIHFDDLFQSSSTRLKTILKEFSDEEETRRLLTSLQNLHIFTEKLINGNVPLDIDLHWDSWDRNSNATKSALPSNNNNPTGSPSRQRQRPSDHCDNQPFRYVSKSSTSSFPWSPSSLSKPSTPGYESAETVEEWITSPPSTPIIASNKSSNNTDRKFPITPPPIKRHQTNSFQQSFPLTKSRSHEEHLAHRVEPLDSSQTNQLVKLIKNGHYNHHNSFEFLPHKQRGRLATEPGLEATSPIIISPNRSLHMISPDQSDNCFTDEPFLAVPPRSPRAHGCMVHVIHHRFSATLKVRTKNCHLCEKPMYYGYKCRECKYRCHRDCVDKVPPSCGLPIKYVDYFRETIKKGEERSHHLPSSFSAKVISPTLVKNESTINRESRIKKSKDYDRINIPPFVGPDSSSNTSSCNSSTPSSPALIVNTPPSASNYHSFNFPEISEYSTNQTGPPESEKTVNSVTVGVTTSGGRPSKTIGDAKPLIDSEIVETQKSNDSDKTISGASGSNSTDSEKTLACRVDSLDSQISDMDQSERTWPRQNSLTLREWDIPYDELKIEEEIGTGRFGTVFKGNWHGSVAIKRLNMNNSLDDKSALEAFKQEVATFRKTRHENLVLFMGACMKPPHLAIVTSLCKGLTLYTHIHLRRDKFNLNRTIIISQQISQGMGYLHARGIVHKDLKTKNIFYENGKVVITDFGLCSVTKLCHDDCQREGLIIPKGWLCYLAPELIRWLRATSEPWRENLPFTMASDVFAFGTVWYELLLGEWPFKGQPPEVIIWQVAKGIKQSLINLQASKEVKDILMLCWAFKSQDRPDFCKLLDILSRLPKKRLQRSPSHPIHLLRSAESLF